ncbi:MAG: hypothetical protein KDD63_20625 [Bacteroidetes bacterium]|nr:hypothetical protein [Bacteroidota bacterium]
MKWLFPFSVLWVVFIFACGDSSSQQKLSSSPGKPRKSRPPFEIIRNDDCFTCHNIYDKTIGPAYIEVARKYDPTPETINRLAEKIIEGGGGLWGGALMSKHPLLKKPDVKKVVEWILNLDNPEVTQFINGPGYRLEELLKKNSQEGLQAEIYLGSDLKQSLHSKFPAIDSTQKPAWSFSLPEIHFKDSGAFAPLNERFYLRIKGEIHIPTTGIYLFRLEKSSPGELKIDGLTAIANRPDDQEINLHLEKGIHELTVHFLGKSSGDTLSLQWISRQEEYFHVIPDKVLR